MLLQDVRDGLRTLRRSPGFTGATHDVVGSGVVIADKPLTVIGVMPESFEPIAPADVFVPRRPGLSGPGGGFSYAVAGRIRQGTSLAQANADLAAAWHAFAAEFPEIKRPDELPARVIPLQEAVASPIRPALLMMDAAVGLHSGVVIGTVAAVFATRVLRNVVWQVSTLDPATFAGVALLLLSVSCAASAVRLDQAAALRE